MNKKKVLSWNFELLNVRIVFLMCAFIHLAVTAVVTLCIDTTIDEDPKVKAYYFIRWKLVTCWFNLISLMYLPTRLYSDWRTKRGEGNSLHIKLLIQATDIVMTGLLFPVTLFSSIMFWYLYTMDPALLAPPRVFHYLPYWAQHSLHSVSIFVVLLDLVLTPRRRPTTLNPRIALLLAFTFIYTLMLFTSLAKGEIVYPVLEYLSVTKSIFLVMFSVASLLLLFVVQWMAIDLLWATNPKRKNSV